MKLEKYEWTQIQAALLFWAHAAEYSSVHPSQHPRVKRELPGFGEGLTADELLLLAYRPYTAVIGAE
jgi:hypothetical protein